jgi:peptidoglycan/LPS O-acetylase OafA/YrhL
LWSYAIYLTHKQLLILIGDYLKGAGYDVESPAAIFVMLLASVAAGWLLYRVVETPFMKLRERYVPSNAPRRRDAAARPDQAQREAA